VAMMNLNTATATKCSAGEAFQLFSFISIKF